MLNIFICNFGKSYFITESPTFSQKVLLFHRNSNKFSERGQITMVFSPKRSKTINNARALFKKRKHVIVARLDLGDD